MLKLGVIGMGLRAHDFLCETMNSIDPDFRIACIVDPAVESARNYLRDCDKKDTVFYDSVEELLKNAKPDGIFVGTRCNLHTPMAIALEKYGVPIYLEKPVATSMEQALELERVFRRSKTPVVVSFPLRVTPLCEKAKAIIRSGAIGEVLHVTGLNYVPYGCVYFEVGYRNYAVTQGLFLQKATHDFDYMMELAGSPITRISANWLRGRVFGGQKPGDLVCSQCPEAKDCRESTRNRIKNCVGGVHTDHLCVFSEACGNPQDGINEDASNAIFEFANGAIGTYAQVFFTRRQGQRGATVSGPLGRVSFDWYTNELQHIEHYQPFNGTYAADNGQGHFGGDHVLAQNFHDLIEYGTPSISTIQAGLRSVFTCLAAKEAAATGKTVDVHQIDW
ncbi:MAG: Gfo/Idh/MocA family oxidoreductase [Victivallales bacterium]|nr:Gfo/Idh/MocA family oxidoreductase [Victivallales bacterium]